MAKVTIPGHIYWRQSEWGDKPEYLFLPYDLRDWSEKDRAGRVHVCEHTTEVEVPDNFDPRPQQIASLQAEQARVRAEMSARIKQIQDRINSLMAIEMSEA